MLQSTMWLQLARINYQRMLGSVRFIMDVNYQPPLKVTLNQMTNTLDRLNPNAKHWFIGGHRCAAVGIKLLQEGKIIAVPTDTIYGLAALAQNTNSVAKLYELKGRSLNKPLAICVSSIKDIHRWGEIDHLPKNLLMSLLPGPVTIILKRKSILNPNLNPEFDTIGIRVPETKFLRNLCKILDQPLVLTSANSSGDQSSTSTEEFSHLWPYLGGIFYSIPEKKKLVNSSRIGSTIVDLTIPNQFNVVRQGTGIIRTLKKLCKYGLKQVAIDEN